MASDTTDDGSDFDSGGDDATDDTWTPSGDDSRGDDTADDTWTPSGENKDDDQTLDDDNGELPLHCRDLVCLLELRSLLNFLQLFASRDAFFLLTDDDDKGFNKHVVDDDDDDDDDDYAPARKDGKLAFALEDFHLTAFDYL